MTIEQLTHDALSRSEAERARLAHALLRSLGEPEEDGVAEAWDDEIARRLSRAREGTAEGKPADEVFSGIRAKYSR